MNASLHFVRTLCLATGLAAFAAGPVMAEPDCGPMGQQQEHHGKMKEMHHRQLHAALKLTPEQEPAWNKLLESEQPKPGMHGQQHQDWSTLKTPERTDRMLELAKVRQERMLEHATALKAFYGTLTPEQQKVFDDFHNAPRKGMRGQAGRNAPAPAPARNTP